jgi:tetratricopeptide (TPR) repeat protein
MATKATSAKKSVSIPTGDALARYAAPVLIVFTLLLYANSLFNGYNMDDNLVTQNHKLTSQGFKAIPEILASPYYSDDMGYQYEYRPVVHITFAIEHQLFGEHAFVSHAINLLIYMLLVLAVYRLFNSLLGKEYTLYVLLVSLLFAAFPLHTEAVCSIKNRDELLAALLGVYTAHLCLLSVQRQNYLYLLGAVLTLFVGMYTKQNIIHFIFIVPLLLLAFTGVSRRQLLIITAALALVGVSFSGIPFVWQKVMVVVAIVLFALVLRGLQKGTFIKLAQRGLQRLQQLIVGVKPAMALTLQRLRTALLLLAKALQYLYTFLKKPAVVTVLVLAGITAAYASQYMINTAEVLTLAGVALLAATALHIRQQTHTHQLTLLSVLWISGCGFWFNNVLLLQIAQYLLISWMLGHPQNPYRWWGLVPFATLLGIEAFTNLQISITSGVIFIGSLYLLLPRMRWLSLMFIAGGIIGNIHALYQKQQLASLYELIIILQFTSFGLIPLFKTQWPHRVLLAVVMLLALITLARNQPYFMPRLTAVSTVQTSPPVAPPPMPHPPVVTPPTAPPPLFTATDIRNLFYTHAPKPIPFENYDRPLDFVEMPLNQKTAPDTLAGTYLLVIGKYLRLMLVPYPMCFYYGYSEIAPQTLWSPLPLLLIFIHVCLLLAALYFFHAHPLPSAGLMIYLTGVAIYSNAAIPTPGIVAERFMLVPSIGLCMMLAYALFMVFKTNAANKSQTWQSSSNPFRYTFLALLLLYSGLTFTRNPDWKDHLTLMRHDIHHVPQSAQAHNLLAFALMKQSTQETNPSTINSLQTEATIHFKKALDIYPGFFNVAYDLGRVYLELKQPQNAIEAFQRAERIDPRHQLPSLCFTLADLYLSQRQDDSAMAQYRHAIQHTPTDYTGYDKLSYLYYLRKQYSKALEVNLQAIKMMPANYVPYGNIGHIYKAMNQKDSALQYYQKAISINPNDQGITAALQQLNKK